MAAEVTLKFELAALIQKKSLPVIWKSSSLKVVEVPVYQMRSSSFRLNKPPVIVAFQPGDHVYRDNTYVRYPV